MSASKAGLNTRCRSRFFFFLAFSGFFRASRRARTTVVYFYLL
jgi:hypothetical protein